LKNSFEITENLNKNIHYKKKEIGQIIKELSKIELELNESFSDTSCEIEELEKANEASGVKCSELEARVKELENDKDALKDDIKQIESKMENSKCSSVGIKVSKEKFELIIATFSSKMRADADKEELNRKLSENEHALNENETKMKDLMRRFQEDKCPELMNTQKDLYTKLEKETLGFKRKKKKEELDNLEAKITEEMSKHREEFNSSKEVSELREHQNDLKNEIDTHKEKINKLSEEILMLEQKTQNELDDSLKGEFEILAKLKIEKSELFDDTFQELFKQVNLLQEEKNKSNSKTLEDLLTNLKEANAEWSRIETEIEERNKEKRNLVDEIK
jgi:chromosome segregation ATPase